MVQNSPEGRFASEAADDSDLGTPVQCTPSPSPLRPFLAASSSGSGSAQKKLQASGASQPGSSSTAPGSRMPGSSEPTGLKAAHLRRSTSPLPEGHHIPLAHVLGKQMGSNKDVQRRPSLISLSEADFLNSELDRSSVESRAGIVSLSYMMSVWDKESNEREDHSSCAISDVFSLGGPVEADLDTFAFEVDPQALELQPAVLPSPRNPEGSPALDVSSELATGTKSSSRDKRTGEHPEKTGLQSITSQKSRGEAKDVSSTRGSALPADPDRDKAQMMDSAFSRFKSRIAKAWASTLGRVSQTDIGNPAGSNLDHGKNTTVSPDHQKLKGVRTPTKHERASRSRSRSGQGHDRPSEADGSQSKRKAHNGASRSVEEGQARQRRREKPRSHPLAQDRSESQLESLGTGSSKSQRDSQEKRKRRHRRLREARALSFLTEIKPLASIKRVPASAILRSYDGSPLVKQTAALPYDQDRAACSGSQMSESHRGSLPGSELTGSSESGRRPSSTEQSWRGHRKDGVPRPADVPGTPEIQELVPASPFFDSAKSASASPQQDWPATETGRPVRSSSGEAAAAAALSQVSEKRAIRAAPSRKETQAKALEGKHRRRPAHAKQVRAGSSGGKGRPLSLLLTSMPEITDIGFKGSLQFMRKLSKGQPDTIAVTQATAGQHSSNLPTNPRNKDNKAAVASVPASPVDGGLGKENLPSASPDATAVAGPDDKEAVAETDASSLQTLVDRGPLKRSPGLLWQQTSRRNDWLYATMPSPSSTRMPDNLHLLQPSANRVAALLSAPGMTDSLLPQPDPLGKVEYEEGVKSQPKPGEKGENEGPVRANAESLQIATPASEPAKSQKVQEPTTELQPSLVKFTDLPAVKAVSESRLAPGENKATVNPLADYSQPQAESSKPQTERIRPVQRALFKTRSSSQEVPAAESSGRPSVGHARDSTDSRQSLGSRSKPDSAAAGAVEGKAVVSGRHPLMQHITPVKPQPGWRSHSLPPASSHVPPRDRRCSSLPEQPARQHLQGLPAGTPPKVEPVDEVIPHGALGVEWIAGGKYTGQLGGSGAEGVGVLTKEEGGSYAGKWEHSAFQGAGVEDFPLGQPILEFLGQFHHGLRHGAGICRFSNGSVYVGEWHQGNQHGIGRLDCKSEMEPRMFIGCFRHNVRHGLGVASYKNGEEYAGEFHAGAADGYGVGNLGGRGGIYEGEWRDGTRHGWAVSTLSNKSMWAGQWIGGRPCWLAQLRSTSDGELADDSAEAMDICDEVARRARAIGNRAKLQAHQFSEAEGHMQHKVQQAVAEAQKEARRAHIAQQQAQNQAP